MKVFHIIVTSACSLWFRVSSACLENWNRFPKLL